MEGESIFFYLQLNCDPYIDAQAIFRPESSKDEPQNKIVVINKFT